jgi:hypothetical protein
MDTRVYWKFQIDELRNQIRHLISRPHGSSHPVTTRSPEPGDVYTSVFVYTTASVTSATLGVSGVLVAHSPLVDRGSFRSLFFFRFWPGHLAHSGPSEKPPKPAI